MSCKGLLKDFVGLKSFSIEKDLCIGIVRKLQFQKGMGKLACDLAQCEAEKAKKTLSSRNELRREANIKLKKTFWQLFMLEAKVEEFENH